MENNLWVKPVYNVSENHKNMLIKNLAGTMWGMHRPSGKGCKFVIFSVFES